MKEIIEQWADERILSIAKWQECTIIDMDALWIEINNTSISIEAIKRLNTLLSKSGYTYRFDNFDIYNGVITLWFY